MNVLDLFSGIGGFSIGLERSGMNTVAFCEYDEHARNVLSQHWPNVPIYPDVREVTFDKLQSDGIGRIDVITGGFPCQDLSCAGTQVGWEGERSSLYIEMLRIISEVRPQYAIFENVANLLWGNNGRWFSRFLNDLAAIGYDAEWHCISASYIGAPHHRDRIWILAYPTGFGLSIGEIMFPLIEESKIDTGTWNGHRVDQPAIERVVDGIPGQLDRLKRCGNAVVPQIPEIIGRAIMQLSHPSEG